MLKSTIILIKDSAFERWGHSTLRFNNALLVTACISACLPKQHPCHSLVIVGPIDAASVTNRIQVDTSRALDFDLQRWFNLSPALSVMQNRPATRRAAMAYILRDVNV